MEYKLEQSLLGHQKGVRCITHISNSSCASIKFASGGDMGEVIIWKLGEISFEPLLQYIPHVNTVMCLVSSYDKSIDSTVIYSGGRDNIIVKSTINGDLLHKFTGHSGPICSISLVIDKGMMLSGSWDGSVIVWDIEITIIKYRIDGFQYGLYPSYCNINGYIYLGSQNGHITVWNGNERIDVDTTIHKDAVRTVKIYNQTLLTSSNDFTVKTCNLKFSDKKEFSGHTSFVYDAHITNDGYNIISASEDCTVIVWDINSISSIQIIPHPSTVWQVASFDTRLVTACQDGRVRIYNKDPDFIPDPMLINCDSDKPINDNIPKTSDGKTYYAGDSQFPCGTYDYIFQVEQNGRYYSLPYNRGDNPRNVAEKFCKNAMISSNSVDTIVDFIIKNVPNLKEDVVISIPIPISFPDVSKDKLFDKIKEFNLLVSDDIKLTDIELGNIKRSLNGDRCVESHILSKLYLWPKDQLIPVVDLLRVMPLKSDFNVNVDFAKILIRIIESNESEILLSLSLKAIANSLYLTVPKMRMENYMPQICNVLFKIVKITTLKIQQPLSVVVLNYSHILISRQHSEHRDLLLKLITQSLLSCKSYLDGWGMSVSTRLIMSLYKLQSIDSKILIGSEELIDYLLEISQSKLYKELSNDVRGALTILLNSILN